MLSIVVPHAGPLEPLKRCLESVLGAIMTADTEPGERSPSIPFEVIVAVDRPDPRTLEYLKQPYIRVNPSEALVGTEAALNRGLREAKGEFLCYLMSDVEVVTPGAFDEMVEALQEHPEFGWVAISSEHTGFLAGCSVWTGEAFEKVGAWDEGYESGGGFSDDDYLRRMWKAGYKPHIVVGPRVRHSEATSTTQLLGREEKAKRFQRNQQRFSQRYGETGTDWDSMPRYQPPPQVHRIEWIKGRLSLRDTILEVGVAENPVFGGAPFRVVTLDMSVRPEEKCFPDVVALAEHLPFKDRVFDVVCANELLEHARDPQQVLKEAARVARKKVIVTVPAEHLWPKALKPFWNPGHVRFYTKETFEGELKQLGLPFKVETIRHKYWRHYGAEIYCDGGKTMESQVKLNLGSFVDTIGHGFENIDILNVKQHIPADHRFRQWDLRRGIPHPDSSVDLIRMSHLIEHLTLEEAKALLRECFRVLKPGGLVRISTPDIDIILRHYRNRDMSFFNQIQPPEYIQAPTEGEKLSRLLFSGDYQHKAVYSFEMLRSFLEQAGFRPDRIFKSVAGFSHSEEMQSQTVCQHIEISLIEEAVK